MSDVWGGDTLPCDLSHDAFDVTYTPSPPVDRQMLVKHYLPATLFADGNNGKTYHKSAPHPISSRTSGRNQRQQPNLKNSNIDKFCVLDFKIMKKVAFSFKCKLKMFTFIYSRWNPQVKLHIRFVWFRVSRSLWNCSSCILSVKKNWLQAGSVSVVLELAL